MEFIIQNALENFERDEIKEEEKKKRYFNSIEFKRRLMEMANKNFLRRRYGFKVI